MKSMRSRFCSLGVTLVELIVSIVVIGTALAGVLVVIIRNTSASADPMIWHQAAIIAEAYLEEVLTKNFSDPDGSNAGETRATYDDVSDYNNIVAESPPRDQSGTAIASLAGYTVKVEVTAPASAWNGIAVIDVWHVQVTVTTPASGTVVVSGYRTRY